jgi:hypothetical protein
MKLMATALLLFVAVASPEIRYFRYERPLQNIPSQPAQACLVLDTGIFAHAAPQLADLRLYHNSTETPYVVHFAAPIEVVEKPLPPLNLGMRGGQTVFDADLHEVQHETKYSDIELAVTGENFIATVTVSGGREQAESNETKLGSYTIFDLTRQKLGRSTVLHLPESDFQYLHFQITGPLSPESITGLSVVRLPISQPKYETVAESSHIVQKGHSSILEFTVPAHLPVDRVAFMPGAEPANFSRNVRITVTPVTQSPPTDTAESPQTIASGNLLRVHRTQSGHKIDEERLAIDAPWTDFGRPEKWTITIDNGDDIPLQLASVQLQMLARNLCFEATGGAGYALFYGDPALSAPRYDYSTLFSMQADASSISAGPEQSNPEFQPRPDDRPLTERHPALLWAALVIVIVLLGTIALRSAKPPPPAPS